ncbi:RcnB family protein [Sphingomonas sp. SUN019]|uniref:RcnB family protein n=1 Tax=Sphingomonas sp. SUN019 TaxID=2937788 RepID=UPI002164B866|nr:RcnB family protein [Sphingomonas sp. SUN019]UVO50710.1 RcnB family protein [Sphingomonas sp. SUN019]
MPNSRPLAARPLVARSIAAGLATIFAVQSGLAAAAAREDGRPAFAMEHQRAPLGYRRLDRPEGVDLRPDRLDRSAFNHNFRADHAYRIGRYPAPPNWHYRRWHYGEFLPSFFWRDQYRIADFWLFGLDVPPTGYEWVRYGPDALLIDVRTGEVIQVDYSAFA